MSSLPNPKGSVEEQDRDLVCFPVVFCPWHYPARPITIGSSSRGHVFGADTEPETTGPRFELPWTKSIGSRVKYGGGLDAVVKQFPLPKHSFTYVPAWTGHTVQIARLLSDYYQVQATGF